MQHSYVACGCSISVKSDTRRYYCLTAVVLAPRSVVSLWAQQYKVLLSSFAPTVADSTTSITAKPLMRADGIRSANASGHPSPVHPARCSWTLWVNRIRCTLHGSIDINTRNALLVGGPFMSPIA